MSSPPKKRLFGTLRRMLRGRRAPSPREQEWLRLILLVRKLQRSQLGIAHRLDEVRTLTGAAGSLHLDLTGFKDDLGDIRSSAAELRSELDDGLRRLQELPDPAAESAAIDLRAEKLDGLATRLENLLAIAGDVTGPRNEQLVATLEGLSTRVQALQDAARVAEGQNELAQLYERIQELAEGMAERAAAPAPAAGGTTASPGAFEGPLGRLDAQLEYLSSAVQALSGPLGNSALDGWIRRLEHVAHDLAQVPRDDGGSGQQLRALLGRLEGLTERIEQAPVVLPDLPADSMVFQQAAGGQVDELQASLVAEREIGRRSDAELEELRQKLRASELAKVEAETRHAAELTQMADHVQRQLRRVRDDLEKKKRGLAELTQQNIKLQTKIGHLLREAEERDAALQAALGAQPEPAAPLPRKADSSAAPQRDPQRDGSK